MKKISTHKLATLSFVVVTEDDRLDLWPPVEHADVQKEGRDRAAELAQYMRDNQAPMVFGHVSAAIVACGVFGDMETAFFQAVAEMAVGGASSRTWADNHLTIEDYKTSSEERTAFRQLFGADDNQKPRRILSIVA